MFDAQFYVFSPFTYSKLYIIKKLFFFYLINLSFDKENDFRIMRKIKDAHDLYYYRTCVRGTQHKTIFDIDIKLPNV